MSEDPVICYCFGTTRAEVRAHFARPSARLDDLIARTGITTKCTACSLDLDVLLDDLRTAQRVGGSNQPRVANDARGIRFRQERIDSGFLINRDGIVTLVRLANYPPLFEDPELCTPHRYRLALFDMGGVRCAKISGRIGVGEETTIDLSAIERCPCDGWFLIRLRPEGAGHYGTLRPQAILDGSSWTAAYHTQFHMHASRERWRAGAPLLTIGGRTRAVISIINASATPSGFRVRVDGQDYRAETDGELAGNGAALFNVDAAFSDLPERASLILRIRSNEPTRKNLINRHPDGSLGVDHFPNLV